MHAYTRTLLIAIDVLQPPAKSCYGFEFPGRSESKSIKQSIAKNLESVAMAQVCYVFLPNSSLCSTNSLSFSMILHISIIKFS